MLLRAVALMFQASSCGAFLGIDLRDLPLLGERLFFFLRPLEGLRDLEPLQCLESLSCVCDLSLVAGANVISLSPRC